MLRSKNGITELDDEPLTPCQTLPRGRAIHPAGVSASLRGSKDDAGVLLQLFYWYARWEDYRVIPRMQNEGGDLPSR